MNLLKSNRVAWSVAAACCALWATTAPVSWGAVSSGTARLFGQTTDDTSTNTIDIQAGEKPTVTTDADAQSPQCPTIPPAIAELIPPAPPPVAAAVPSQEGSFRICGADPQAARAIEQLIAGRGFSATLYSRGDGCADLNVRVTSGSINGSSTSNLSVSLGSGRTLVLQVASAQGATHASILER
jgi:hypothetical protein